MKTYLCKLFFAFSCITFSFFSYSQVVINEYSCSNINGPTDAFGENEDWVELYNTGSTTVDLSGYYLSDNDNNLTKWQIPSGVTIAPNGYKMIFCSGRGVISGNEIHPKFNLSQTENEWIILSTPASVSIDYLEITQMTKQNHSIGRQTDGSTTWKLFLNPTPNAPNSGGINFYTATPVFSVTPGFYTSTQTVSITCPNGSATIRYTTDGSEPTAASTLYSGPVSISSTKVLRAKAFSADEPSFTMSGTYFINVNHTVPVISIAGAGSGSVQSLLNGNSSIEPQGFFELWEADKSFVDKGEGEFNKHGNDSWAYDQRGIDFIMKDQFGYNHQVKHQIFPSETRTKFQRLILKAGASDNYPFESGGAHIRDAFVQTLSQRAGLKLDERTWRPCVLYVNGVYWGVYEIREKADDHDYTDYYYDQDKYHLNYLKTWGSTWAEYGGPTAINEWNTLKNFILNNNMGVQANFDHVDTLYSWKSLVDYFVVNSYIVNKDWLVWNTAWWHGTDPAGDKKKWRYALWDMDACFGHYINYTNIPDDSPNADPCDAENLPDPGSQGHTQILTKLINENPVVEQYYIARYIDMGNTYFHCNYMIPLLDSMVNQIAPEMAMHCAKWGGTVAGWQSNVQAIRDFINTRCTAINQGLTDCYQVTGPNPVVIDVSPANSGTVKVNSIWAPTYPWNANYFGGIQTNLLAQANAGFTFSHWEYDANTLTQPDAQDTNSMDIVNPVHITAIFTPPVTPPNPPNPPAPEVITGLQGFYLPTAFSPNGDGLNDYFGPKIGEDVASFTWYVYDRWGNRMISSSDPAFKWNGIYNGVKIGTGTYAYQAEILFKDGSKKVQSGSVTVTR
jgi:gliding motility-associated-like protein